MKSLFVTMLALAPVLLYSQPLQTDLDKQDLKGKVQSCTITCYTYSTLKDGTQQSKRGLLHLAGNSYAIDHFYSFNEQGNLIIEHTLSDDRHACYLHKHYVRDESGQIKQIKVQTQANQPPHIEFYEYTPDGKLLLITRTDAQGTTLDTLHTFTYDAQGNCNMTWQEEDMTFTIITNDKEQCIEERALLSNGNEYYHNFHQYTQDGKRVETIFTQNQQVVEIRTRDFADNILLAGEIKETDSQGNWTQKVFPINEQSGSIVIRKIEYYDPAEEALQ